MTEVLHLVDGHAFGHRAYHAAGGRGWQAVGIFAATLDALERRHMPTRAVVVFDSPGRNWRHDLCAGYKADRPRPEVELCRAMEAWKPIAAAIGWPVASARHFEADDVIATLVERARARGWSCIVHAADKDLHQLVSDHVRQAVPGGAELGPAEVEAKLGVPPSRVADYLALCGDTGDSVPGVPGCGPKTAAKLCRTYGSIEDVIAAGAAIRLSGKYPLASAEGVDVLRLSRRLVELARDVDLDLDLDALALGRRDEAAVRDLLAPPRAPEQLELEPPKPTAPKPGPSPHRRGSGGFVRPPPSLPPLTAAQLEDVEERAAILEHEAGMSREDAESTARYLVSWAAEAKASADRRSA